MHINKAVPRTAGAALLALAFLAGTTTGPGSALAGQGAGQGATQVAPGGDRAENVILLIGDGMGEAAVLATRYWHEGRDGRLDLEQLPAFGQVTTHSENDLVTDSAAAGTALATGVRANNGVVSIAPDGTSVLERSILMVAKNAGKSTGLVTEVPMAHATPAPFASSVTSRRMMNEIADQFLTNGVDVLLGGGEGNFRPQGTPGVHCDGSEVARREALPHNHPWDIGEAFGLSKRTDGRDLVEEAATAGYQVATDRGSLQAAQAPGGKLLGLFACENMAWGANPVDTEPTSAEKTRKAIDVLDRNPKGFFLMVERGKIDWAVEANDATETLHETLEFDRAVREAMDFARRDGNTLVIVVADHEAGGMHVISRPERGHSMVSSFTSADGLPLHIAWATRPGHTADPVGVRAFGPGAALVKDLGGSKHLTDVYELMRRAMR